MTCEQRDSIEFLTEPSRVVVKTRNARELDYKTIISNLLLDLPAKAPVEVKGKRVNILPTYKKPFDIIAEGLSRLNWLHRVDEFRNCFLYENI